MIIFFFLNYLLNLVIYILTTCCNVNNGKIYLEKIQIKATNVKIENDNWFKKKKGINWGISLNVVGFFKEKFIKLFFKT